MVHATKQSPTGAPFDDLLNELHAHAFSGVPGESTPFTLSLLEREYIAFVLAEYYQCAHCEEYHGKQIEHLLAKEQARHAKGTAGTSACSTLAHAPDWPWRKKLENALLYLRVEQARVSEQEWSRWQHNWMEFAGMVRANHGFCLSAVAYAVGVARDDEALMEFIFPYLSRAYPDNGTLDGVIRDMARVVVFMKAATTKNRVIGRIKRHLMSRGIE